MKKYVYINDNRHKIIKEYTTSYGDKIIRYRDKTAIKDTLKTCGIIIVRKEILNGWILCDYKQINWFNPSTYIVLLFATIIYFIMHGLSDFSKDWKEAISPYRINTVWHEKDSIKIVEE